LLGASPAPLAPEGFDIQLIRPAPHAGRAGYAEGEVIGGARAGRRRVGLADAARATGAAARPTGGSGDERAGGQPRMVLLPICSRQAAQPGWTLSSASSKCAGSPGWTAVSAISTWETTPASSTVTSCGAAMPNASASPASKARSERRKANGEKQLRESIMDVLVNTGRSYQATRPRRREQREG